MDEETCYIGGEKYSGIFKGNLLTEEREHDSMYHNYLYTDYCYKGSGIVKDKNTGEKYFFMFETEHFEEYFSYPKCENWAEKNYSLEEGIVCFNQKGPFDGIWDEPKPVVVDGMYEKIADISLKNIVEQVKSSSVELPLIRTKRMKVKDLAEKGFCVGKNGQIWIPFPREVENGC